MSITCGQRPAKRQPGGRLRSEGTDPGITANLSFTSPSTGLGRWYAHHRQQFDSALASLLPVVTSVYDQGLRNLVAYPEHRIETGGRLLKDHGDAVAPDMAHLFLAQAGNIEAAQANLSLL